MFRTVKACISTQENFRQKENFVKCDWQRQIFRRETNFEVENFQLLTMIFSESFLSVEIFLEWKWALRLEALISNATETKYNQTTCKLQENRIICILQE